MSDEENKVEEQVEKVDAAEVEVAAETEVVAEDGKKKKKEPKKFPAKKLPGLLKKNYKAEKIEKKLYKKIYVASDKTLVQSLFEENPKKPGYLYIPRDKMIEKIDFKRLKLVAKDVKKQKPSFKLIPFAAVVAAIVAAYIAVITFKNPIAKKAITSAMQGIFGARTDIGWVNVEFMRATITIKNLQQANKDSPMKNLFQIDKTEISFNLTEALRGKFDARNIEVTGLALDTDRTYSGALPKKVEKPKEPNPAMEQLIAEMNKKKDAAIEAARISIENSFAEYNPVNMIENVKDNLKSPVVAQNVQSQVEEAIERWQSKPDEMKKQVEDISAKANNFVKDVNDILNKDFSKMNDPMEIKNTVTQVKNMIDQTNSLIDQSKEMTNTVKGVVDDVKSDAQRIKKISNDVSDALKSDTALVKKQLDKITSFNLDTGTKILSNALDSAMYAVVGSYYPYVVQGVNYAMELKSKSSSGTKEDQKKEALLQPRHERLKGKNIYWRRDRVPKFLIEKIQFSGLGVAVKGTEISSDMDKRGAPATVVGSYQQGDVRTHKANIVVDARSKTSNPLVGLDYSGNNYPFGFEMPYLNMKSNSTIAANASIGKTGAVLIGAELNMATLSLSADEFEPAIAYRFYSAALEEIDSLVVGVQFGVDENRKLVLKVTSELDKQFNTILKRIVNKELKVLIAEAQAQLITLLNEQCGDVMNLVSEFVDIENGINLQSLNMGKVNSLLNEKKAALEAKLKEQTDAAKNEAMNKASSAAKEAVGDVLKDSNIPLPVAPQNNNNNKNDNNTNKNPVGGALKGLLKK